MAFELSKQVTAFSGRARGGRAVSTDLAAGAARDLLETPAPVALSLRDIRKSYGGREVLAGVSLEIRAGQFVGIVGKSGCGKSTLLRLIAGLETPDSGEIRIGDERLAGLNTRSRFMFQDPRLMPWKRVRENVALGLSGRDAQGRAEAALSQVGLADRAGDWPGILSGGQRQRVALARALASCPPLLLLDEPLGALDALTRLEMQTLLERLQANLGFTGLLVTHDIEEAVALCDRVILLEDGGIVSEVEVPLPRPRPRSTTAFLLLKDELLSRLLSLPPTYEI